MSWNFTGRFRLHFNRPNEAPRFVSVTAMDHSWEMICRTVEIENIHLEAGADMGCAEFSPKWWLEGHGAVAVDSLGHAKITGLTGSVDLSKLVKDPLSKPYAFTPPGTLPL